jgi:FtsH-binding integral membrane protein
MSFDPYEFDRSYAPLEQTRSLSQYTVKTFWWMFLGLAVTFGVALFGYLTNTVFYVFAIPYAHILLLVAELVVVFSLVGRLERLSVPAARGMFFLYAAINGVVFSAYFLIYDVASLIFVFGATALYFGAVALYGFFTKADLSGLRTILASGLIFLLAFAVLSLFLPFGSGMERVICLVGIAVFMGFTAYDTQKIRHFYRLYSGDEQMLQRASVYAALQLYLDFVNLFIYLLRILARRRD